MDLHDVPLYLKYLLEEDNVVDALDNIHLHHFLHTDNHNMKAVEAVDNDKVIRMDDHVEYAMVDEYE